MNLEQLRNDLNMSKTDFGAILLGIDDRKSAYITCHHMEKRGRWASVTGQYFKLLEYLINEHPKAIKGFIYKVEKGEI